MFTGAVVILSPVRIFELDGMRQTKTACFYVNGGAFWLGWSPAARGSDGRME